MLAALAYVITVFVRIPIMPAAPFLEYDPKDILFVMAGFLIGPVESTIIVILVCLIELFTVSSSGLIGFAMNVIASLCFVLPAAFIYRIKRTQTNAILGLLVSVISMTGAMILWNYIMTPIYMGVPRDVVVGMLPTVILPFNVIKAGINMALTLIIYKPISLILHKAGVVDSNSDKSKVYVKDGVKTEDTDADKKKSSKKFSPFAILVGVVILAMCICALFLIN